MSRDRSRSPASFSDSDEEDELTSLSDSEEEDELASFSDSKEEDEPLTMQIGEPLALQIWLREEEEGMHVRAEVVRGTREDLLYSNEGFPGDDNYQKGVTTCANASGAFAGCRNSEETAELKQKSSFCEGCEGRLDQILRRNQQMHNPMMEVLNQLASMYEKNHETQQSIMRMIQKTHQLAMTKLLPPQQPMQQQPLQPAAAATSQPQPQLGLRTDEDEGEKNASAHCYDAVSWFHSKQRSEIEAKMSQDSSRSLPPASFSDSKEECKPLTLQAGAQVPEIKKGEPLVVECWLKEVEDGMHFSQASIFRNDRVSSSNFLPVIGYCHCQKGGTSTNTGGSSTGCEKSGEITELKQKQYSCENYERKVDQILHQNQQMHNSMTENLTRVASIYCKSLDTQESVIKMIQETQQLVVMTLLPPEQQPMQQQQPLQPAAAAPQPQPQTGQRTEEDESEKNASEDHMRQSPNMDY